MTSISVDRFLALQYHMRYANLMTCKRATYPSATFWFMKIVLSYAIYVFEHEALLPFCSSWRFHFSYFFIFLHQNLPLLFAGIQAQQQAEVNLL